MKTQVLPQKSRRAMLRAMGLGASALAVRPLHAATPARVVVVGAGYGGATLARSLRTFSPQTRITLIDRSKLYTSCPFSNLVISGYRSIDQQRFDWTTANALGINTVQGDVVEVDPVTRRLSLADGSRIDFDKLVLAPGISIKWNALEGYDEAASQALPHAWIAGNQTELLRRQLEAMPANGVVAMAIPAAPYRCPPGPYERASLIAHYLKAAKPKAKLLLLDAKDRFSKDTLFRAEWTKHYPNTIEWRGLADSGRVIRVDAAKHHLHTEFDRIEADVCNVIPPQQAGAIAERVGATDASGWCPVDPLTFRSTRLPNTYVIGDAAIANAMPKSAFAANAQAKVCALQIARALNDLPPITPTLLNTCYSFLSPRRAISVAGAYRPEGPVLKSLPGTGGTSTVEGARRERALEAHYAHHWFKTITNEAFG